MGLLSEVAESKVCEAGIDPWHNRRIKGTRITGGRLVNQSTDWFGTALIVVAWVNYKGPKEACLLA